MCVELRNLSMFRSLFLLESRFVFIGVSCSFASRMIDSVSIPSLSRRVTTRSDSLHRIVEASLQNLRHIGVMLRVRQLDQIWHGDYSMLEKDPHHESQPR